MSEIICPPEIKTLFRFATEFDEARCVDLKNILQSTPEINDLNAEKFLSACRLAISALNDTAFIVIDINGVKGNGDSLGMSIENQEKFAVKAQQYMLKYTQSHCIKAS